MIFDQLRVLFGEGEKYIDITDPFLNKYYKKPNIYIKRKTRLYIIFSDPKPRVIKNIVIKYRDRQVYKFGENFLSRNNVLFNLDRIIENENRDENITNIEKPENNKSINTNDKNIIIRILGNDIPGLHNESQTYNNLKFTLENEDDFPQTDKLYLLNKIYNQTKLSKITDLLDRHNANYKLIPFPDGDFFDLDKELLGEEISFQKYKTRRFSLKPFIKKLISINDTIIGINKARNWAIDYGKKKNYNWIFVLDSNQYFLKRDYEIIINSIKSDSQVLIIPQYRLDDKNLDNQVLLNINNSQKINSLIRQEGQIVVKFSSNITFHEDIQYGFCDKAELLRYLGVPGIWTRWNDNLKYLDIKDRKNINRNTNKYQIISKIYRLNSFQSTNTRTDNWVLRIEGLIQLAKQITYENEINNTLSILENNNSIDLDRREQLVFNIQRTLSLLSKKIVVLTVYFNYTNNIYYSKNYHIFRQNIFRQGVKLYTLELYLNKPEISNYNEVVSLKTRDIMWHKENALNYLLKYVPENTEVVCWIDNDIIFTDDSWLINLYKKIKEGNNIVQLFQYAKRLSFNSTLKLFNNCLNSDKNIMMGYQNDQYLASCLTNMTETTSDGKYLSKTTTPGYAWAIKYDILKKVNGFYDHCILGGGDQIIKNSILKKNMDGFCYYKDTSTVYRDEISNYQLNLNKLIDGKACHLDGIIYHLYHGSYKKRQYIQRYEIFNNIKNFNPLKHLVKYNNLYKWSNLDDGDLLILKQAINNYFLKRNEIHIAIYGVSDIFDNLNKPNINIQYLKTQDDLDKIDPINELVIIKDIAFSEIIKYLNNKFYYLLLDYNIIGNKEHLVVYNKIMNDHSMSTNIEDFKKLYREVFYFDNNNLLIKDYLMLLFK